jgi:transcriptional regulator with XRE-family HTH domain
MPRRKSDAIDRVIGQNVRFYRLRRFMKQARLATAIGVTYQQVQKYEKGASPIAASRLFQISRVLGVSLCALFSGADIER